MAILPVGIGPQEGGYQIERSLRFNSADSAYLNRTPASAGNRKTWTWSGWVKRSSLSDSGYMYLFGAYPGSSATDTINFVNQTIRIWFNGSTSADLQTTQLFRDVSAWYHILVAVDTTQATASNRIKLYVNGVQVTSFSTASYPTQNYDTLFNSTSYSNQIGANGNGPQSFFDGYLTEVNFIDGQALAPTSFGEYNSDTGVWQPKAYTGSYGTNGFYLDFADNSSTTALGYDAAGSNDWTPNNFSVTAGAGNDSLVDTPTPYGTDTGAGGEVRGNYCTLNTISAPSAYVLSDGNLNFSATASDTSSKYLKGTVGVSSGKWYWEVTPSNIGGGPNLTIGIQNASYSSNTGTLNTIQSGYGYYAFGQKEDSSGQTSYGASYAANDVIGVAFDADSGTITFYKNNTSQGTAFSSIPAGTYIPVISFGTGGVSRSIAGASNFGQRPFAYTAPSGFKALCTQNLPEPTVKDGGDYMNVSLYSGSATTPIVVTNSGSMQPDFVWVKRRDTPEGHSLFDSVRGVTKVLVTNVSEAEGTNSAGAGLVSFNSNGFSIGTQNTSIGGSNAGAGSTYVGWQWKANGAGVSNTAGTITSTVSANTTAGFSIVTYTGTANSETVGHGLGVAPSMIIVKVRGTSGDWPIYHASVGREYFLLLNSTNAVSGQVANYWGTSGIPSSTVFGIKGGGWSNNFNGYSHVAYCFAPVAGYSAFGSVSMNASSDGSFIYTGFLPKLVLLKRSDSTSNWIMWDTVRNTYNVVGAELYPNLSNAESTVTDLDILSNGFKMRNSGFSGTWIYAAWADVPFRYSLAR